MRVTHRKCGRHSFLLSFLHSLSGYLLGIDCVSAVPVADANPCPCGAGSLVGTQPRNTMSKFYPRER